MGMTLATQVEFHRTHDEIDKNTRTIDSPHRQLDRELAIREDRFRDQESRGTVIGEQVRPSEDLAECEAATRRAYYLDGPSGRTAKQPAAHRPTLPVSSTWRSTLAAAP